MIIILLKGCLFFSFLSNKASYNSRAFHVANMGENYTQTAGEVTKTRRTKAPWNNADNPEVIPDQAHSHAWLMSSMSCQGLAYNTLAESLTWSDALHECYEQKQLLRFRLFNLTHFRKRNYVLESLFFGGFFAIIWSFSNRKSFKLACIFFSLQTFSPINNQGLLRSLQVIICVLWQPQAAANWQASMREMLCKFYEWQRRLVEWLCTCNFDLLGAVHAGRWKGRQERRRPWIRFCALHKKSTFEMNC